MKDNKRRSECVFCEMVASSKDEAHLILYRGAQNFIVLNKYPYITGHLMIVPYTHTGELSSISKDAQAEMMHLADMASKALEHIYEPHGFNMGMNIGRAAGAGLAEHIHFHVLPRWSGDVNFITSVGDTRVIPEDLVDTYRKLKSVFDRA